MDDADAPSTQPSGFLVPPTKVPRTALAVATPPPPRRPARVPAGRSRMTPIGFVANIVFDAVDAVADAVAVGLSLRDR